MIMAENSQRLLDALSLHGFSAATKKEYHEAKEIIETAMIVEREQARLSALEDAATEAMAYSHYNNANGEEYNIKRGIYNNIKALIAKEEQ